MPTSVGPANNLRDTFWCLSRPYECLYWAVVSLLAALGWDFGGKRSGG